jgi:hypothetical protein
VITYYNDRLTGLLASRLSSLITTQALWPQNIYTKALWPKISWLTSLYVHLQLGFILGVLHSPPPYLCIVLSALYTHVQSKSSKIFKKMWVLFPHGIFMLPGCIFRTVTGPLDLYQPYCSILSNLTFLIQYAHRLYSEVSFLLHLNHIPINYMISIRYILFKQRHMEYIMNAHGCR